MWILPDPSPLPATLAGAWLRCVLTPHWAATLHPPQRSSRRRDHHTLVVTLGLTGNVSGDGWQTVLMPPAAVLIPAGRAWTMDLGSPAVADGFQIGFALSGLDGLPDPLLRLDVQPVPFSDMASWRAAGQELLRIHPRTRDSRSQAQARPLVDTLVQTHLATGLSLGVLEHPLQPSGAAPWFDEALRRLQNHSRTRPLRLAEIAAQVGISVLHLRRTFRRRCGVDLATWFRNRRLDEAGRLLRTELRLAVSEISQRCGFRPAAFTNAFQRQYGMTPTAWRRGESPQRC